jgi:HEAT repeat protein
MLKILPDAVARLQRRLASGPVEQRLKAMQMAQELELGEVLKDSIAQLCADPNPRLRSKAVALAGAVPGVGSDVLVERLLHDGDPRVRANAIEALEGRRDPKIVAALARRARSANSRERANAIKALHKLRVGTLTGPLLMMLRDTRSEHRISAIWALRQVGWWQLLGEVGRLAKSDADLRVRRYALGVLRGVADLAAQARKPQPAAKQAG